VKRSFIALRSQRDVGNEVTRNPARNSRSQTPFGNAVSDFAFLISRYRSRASSCCSQRDVANEITRYPARKSRSQTLFGNAFCFAYLPYFFNVKQGFATVRSQSQRDHFVTGRCERDNEVPCSQISFPNSVWERSQIDRPFEQIFPILLKLAVLKIGYTWHDKSVAPIS